MPAGQADAPGRQDHPSTTIEPSTPSVDRFQILALDGGGAKALFTAHVLARLEQDLDVSIKDSFDLIAGTSAGGIVALGLGAGLPPSEIVGHYEELVEAVFPAVRRRLWRRPRQLTAPIYDGDALRTALTKVLGEGLLGDSAKRLVIPAWDVQRGSVHIVKAPHLPRLARDWGFRLDEVKVPVRWWHGDRDHIVPYAHGEHVVAMLPDAELYSLPGESHLGGLGEAEAIMATMSELWDDYQKDRNKG